MCFANNSFNCSPGANAHVDVLTALKDFPAQHYGTKPEGAPHSAWELLEHMRIALRDLWDFSTNPEYVEKNWPEDYWPKSAEPPSKDAWKTSVRALEEDLAAFGGLVKNPASNLFAQIPWGTKIRRCYVKCFWLPTITATMPVN